MCLLSKNKEPNIANKNIVGYKVIINLGNKWMAPYMLNQHEYGQLIDKNPKVIDKCVINHKDNYSIGKGYFHLYKNFDTAKADLNYLDNAINTDLEIVKCVIPKGANYYIGSDDDLCSNEIIIYKNDTNKYSTKMFLFFKKIIYKLKNKYVSYFK